ncbi:ATP-dependent translocase ABCB1-like isoform X2 [Rana temporaria]|uniref:ATP-dependent translocase ABCB1-like isoform X2 n=1 Tax=Rana temporaria TaxID=8407 RepID=UPI001AAC840D|nr:ATP-dependent translocase ABCB1-like isoform X2 [Rana temporaria]
MRDTSEMPKKDKHIVDGFPDHVYDNPTFQQDEKAASNGIIKQETDNGKKGKKHGPVQKRMVGSLELLVYADKWDILLMILGLASALGAGTGLPIMIIVFGDMTDSFVQSGISQNLTALNITPPPPGVCNQKIVGGVDIEAKMTTYAYYYVAIGCGMFVLTFFEIWAFVISAARQSHRIRQKFFKAVLHQEMSWFDTTQIGTLNTRLTDDINTIHDGLGDKISIFIQFFSTFLTGIIIGFIYGWKLTLVIMSVSPLLGVSAALWSKLLATFTIKELASYSQAGAVAEEVLTAIRTVVAFNGQEKALTKYDANLQEAKRIGIKKSVTTNVSMGLTQFLIFGAYALAFWYGTKLTVDEPENYTIGTVLIVFFSVLIGTFSLGQAAPNLESISNARGAAYEVYSIIDKHRPIDSSSNEGHKPEKLTGNIEFKNIHFSYPTRPDTQILKSLNLKVKAGQTVALVGASGCGKSTTIQLLQRFYDPLIGEVTVDGHDIRTLNVKWLRENIGVVSQEPVLFGTTIKENIRYGREDVTDAEIIQATKEANAYDFISKLPDGLDTMVGERGAQLSGGQKQRIAIARALARNPRILLLDEATSALDTQSERIVQNALDKARAGRTTIVIAHRLSTIRTADVIAGFHNGVVVEQGSHEDLMNKQGVYYSLVMLQSYDKIKEDEVNSETEEEDEEDEGQIFEYEDINEDDADVAPDSPNHGNLEIMNSDNLHRHSSRRKSRRSTKRKSKSKKNAPKQEEVVEDLPDFSLGKMLALNKPEYCYIAMGVIAAAISGGIYPTFAIIFGKVIGSFSITDPDERSQRTILLSLMFLVLGVISLIVYVIMGFSFGISGENLTLRLRSLSFKALLRQEIGYFDDHANAVGVLLTRLATDASQVKGMTGGRLGLLTISVCTLLTAIIIAFVYGWQLTLLILACIPFLIGSNFIRMKAMTGHATKDQKALEDAGRISTECVENIRTVVSLTREEAFFNLYNLSLTGPYKDSIKKAHIHGLTYALSQSINFFVNAAVFRFGAWLIANCHTQFENVFIVFSTIIFAAMNVGQTSSLAPDMGKAKVSSQRIMKLLDRQPAIDSYSEDGEKLSAYEGNLEFKDIKFVYPTRPKVQVLQGLNVKVTKGQTLALVGSSGCGKSTSVQLLERFYDPVDGKVLADGIDTKTLNLKWLRSQMGIVSQEPMLFDCSIAENIQYGALDREVTQEEIVEAAKAANIHTFIENLPDKYNTRVGDKGAQLSGGQKQRIAIARALIRKPKVLLLDEATSALDTESEKVVQKALDDARQGRTCVVIAHRLTTVQNADIIAVIQNGRVIEQGTHPQLLARQGAYYALVNSQVTN